MFLMEMSNVIQKYTGLPGNIYVSSKDELSNIQSHSLGRVKYIKAGVVVSCSIKTGRNGRIKKFDNSNSEAKKMIKNLEIFIILNEDVLWEFWNTSKEDADIAELISKLIKV